MNFFFRGKAFECVARLLDPVYADGVSAPKVSMSGRPLPNPRLVSSLLHQNDEATGDFTHMMMLWGQFLDHDLSLSPVAQSRNGGIQCCSRSNHPECFPISIPRGDSFYSRFRQTCMNFVRSARCETCAFGPRLQQNILTAFIDASNVYGSLLNETATLRAFDGLGKVQVLLAI